MSQRHQIILVLPKTYYNVGNPNNKPERAVAIHHQWMWGDFAITQLRHFFKYYTNATCEDMIRKDRLPYCFEDSAHKVLEALYSMNADEGYFHKVHILDSPNPETFDNNDGVTMIDLREPMKPKYCFFFMHDPDRKEKIKTWKVLSAVKYWKLYNEDVKSISLTSLNIIAQLMKQSELVSALKICKKKVKKND